MPWLTRGDEVLANIVTGSDAGAEGVSLLRRPMFFRPGGGDVAWCVPDDPDGPGRPDDLEAVLVRRTATPGAGRRSVLSLSFGGRASAVIVARPGSFDRWGLRPGDLLTITR